jgi:hypothetical protein
MAEEPQEKTRVDPASVDEGDASLLLTDGHVHLHPCFPIGAFLDQAARNLDEAHGAAGLNDGLGGGLGGGAGHSWTGVLLFSEGRGVNRFEELREMVGASPGPDGWTAEATQESGSLRLRSRKGAELLVVAGRQVVTEARLEVLALCTTTEFKDGGTLMERIRQVREAGAVPVVPWGFGKWWGSRGRLLADVVGTLSAGEVLLGDNAVRPRGTPEPKLFESARERGIPVLPGSDPLPFPAQLRQVGSYGAILSGREFDPSRPAETLRRQLLELDPEVRSFGQRVGPLRSAWTQVRLRVGRG